MSTQQETCPVRTDVNVRHEQVARETVDDCLEYLAGAWLAFCRARAWPLHTSQARAAGQGAAITLAALCMAGPQQGATIPPGMVKDVAERIAMWIGATHAPTI